jgi:hypothetical protein
MGHTPGPWRAVGSEVVWLHCPGDQCVVADVLSEEYAADARLIAAAPELLAALRRMREVFEQLADGDWRHLDATYVDQLIESDGLHGCDKALAKAEGRSE